MAGKRKAAIPKTLLRGKHLKTNDTKSKKIEPSKEIEIIISPELKHNNFGNYPKTGKKQNTKNGETTKNKIYKEPINHNEMGNIQHDELKSQETKISFTISENNKKHEKNNCDQTIPSKK